MPVDYSKYPPNWLSEIRPRALERDHHRCRFCGLVNYLQIFRGYDGSPYEVEMLVNALDDHGFDPFGDVIPIDANHFKVILTIAHLDQDITNNEDDNLAALCQRCHLNHDRPFKARKKREEFEVKNPRLFEVEA